jgi:hypothetical protein
MNQHEPIFFTPRARPWDMRRYKGGSSSAPAADPLVGQAAMKQADIAEGALNWYKDVYEKEAPQRAAEYATQQKVTEAGLETSKLQNDIAADYWKQYKDVYQPLEKGIVADAEGYDTAARRDQESGAAQADVSKSFDAVRSNMQRQNMGYGIAPGQGRFDDSSLKMGIEQAKASAGAGTAARKGVETQGWARKLDAASLGRNLPSNQATATQVGLAASGQASGATSAAGAGRRADTAGMGQGYGIGMQGYQSAGSLALGGYNAQLNAWNAQNQSNQRSSAGIGAAFGTIAGAGIGWMAGGPAGAMYGAGIGSQAGGRV